MKQYFKIGEISKLYKIGVDSIRYYEEIGLIQPERSESGYRHYSIHDIWRLNVIRDLRSIGFTMEQIREYLENHTTSSSLKLLEEEQEVIQQQMQYLQKLQKNVAQRPAQTEREERPKTKDRMGAIHARTVASIRF